MYSQNAETSSSTSSFSSTNQRSNSTSSRTPGSHSHMDSIITRLLIQTKSLLEGLAQWSRGEANAEVISAVYVKLGNDFNVACAAFAKENISMTELLSVPAELRTCLENCLSDEPCQDTLDRHLPQVRQIIIGLLTGLREKQKLYREGLMARRGSVRQGSISSASGGQRAPTPTDARGTSPELTRTTSAAQMPITPNSASRSRDELRRFVSQAQAQPVPPQQHPYSQQQQPPPPPPPSSSSSSIGSAGSSYGAGSSRVGQGLPSGPRPRPSDRRIQSSSAGESSSQPSSTTSTPREAPSRGLSQSKSSGTLRDPARSRTSDPSYSSVSPSPSEVSPPLASSSSSSRNSNRYSATRSPPPPPREFEEPVPLPFTPDMYSQASSPATPPPPVTVRPPSTVSVQSEEPFSPTLEVNQTAKQLESFEALKASESLSRRASKRYSAYAIHKITTGSSGSPSGRGGDSWTDPGGMRPSTSAGRELSAKGDEKRSMGPARRTPKSEFRPVRGADGERRPPLPSIPSSLGNDREGRPLTMVEEEFFSPLFKDPNGISNLGGTTPPSPSPSFFSSSSSAPATPPTSSTPAMPSISSTFDDSNTSNSTSSSSPSVSPAIPTSNFSPEVTDSTSAPKTATPTLESVPVIPTVTTTAARASLSASDPDDAETEYPISVYLQIGRDVKKVRLEERPTVAALRVLFIERFQYNPGHADFPNIYLRDPIVGVQYELEDMAEVKNGSVISLNIDTVEQVKQHIDQGISSLTQEIKDLRTTVAAMRRASVAAPPTFSPEFQASTSPMVSRPSERQFQDAAQKVLKLKRTESEDPPPSSARVSQVIRAAATAESSTPVSPSSSTAGDVRSAHVVGVLKTQHEEVQNLRREIGVLRQIYGDFATQTKTMLANVRTQTSHVQNLAATKVSTARAFIDAGKVKLERETTELIERGDRIQDAIDDMRVDVSVKQIRPRPAQTADIASQLKAITKKRDELVAWVASVKPSWKATWSDELETIISEQKLLEAQEGFLSELQVDLEEAATVFSTIQDVIKQPAKVKRPTREFKPAPTDGAPSDSFLLEVKTIMPDADRRLEAIAKAEEARKLELASRTDEFADELGGFVAGNKLKKSGGIEETERLRQARSEANIKAMFSSGSSTPQPPPPPPPAPAAS